MWGIGSCNAAQYVNLGALSAPAQATMICQPKLHMEFLVDTPKDLNPGLALSPALQNYWQMPFPMAMTAIFRRKGKVVPACVLCIRT